MDASEWDRRYDRAEYVWHVEPNRFLPGLVAGLPVGRALDLACGEGRNAVWLAQQGWTVTAVDFSRVGIAKGERLATESGVTVDWQIGDVTTWDAPVGAFDLVVLFYVQLPPAGRAAMLDRAIRALTRRGRLVLVAHDLTNLTDGVGGPQDPAVLPTPELVVADLAAAGVEGLTVERAERIGRSVDTDDGPREAIDCLVVARRD
ncbi:MAG: class I SAM-dependent methyltransferase [Acidimicrobiia bacterium]